MMQWFKGAGLAWAAALALAAGASGAFAQSALVLTTDLVENDPGGTFISVGVKNNGTATIDQIVVTCTFHESGRTVGTASTTLFSTVGGTTGNDQVRLLGAKASSAKCAITSPQ